MQIVRAPQSQPQPFDQQHPSQLRPTTTHHPEDPTASPAATATVYHQQPEVVMATIVPVDNGNVIYIPAADVQVIND